MVSKAKTTCPNGHVMEFGACGKEITRLFFFKSICTSTDHEVLSHDAIQCRKCKTIHLARVCPKCEEQVPVAKFKQKTLMERLKK